MPQPTALIVEVPEAEQAVWHWRARLDAFAAAGVPAHITILSPFAVADCIDEQTIATLRRLFAGVAPFSFSLERIGWFDDTVVWLAPQPDAPFRALIRMVVDAFPAHPPYGGEFADPTPHLTIGFDHPFEQLDHAAQRVQARLPIRCTAAEVALWTPLPTARWQRAISFPLTC